MHTGDLEFLVAGRSAIALPYRGRCDHQFPLHLILQLWPGQPFHYMGRELERENHKKFGEKEFGKLLCYNYAETPAL